MMSAAHPTAARPFVVVTGCSRSGTGYTSRLLTALGVDVGHERVFNIHRVIDGWRPDLLDEADADGDSSFLAAPFVDRLPPGTVVLHQLRHPVAVVRSHLGIRFFREPVTPSIWLADEHEDFLTVVTRYAPRVGSSADELVRAVRYWVAWNRLVERVADDCVYLRYRVEDLDLDLLARIASLLGRRHDTRSLTRALRSVPRRVNHRRRDTRVRASQVWSFRELRETARRYGYHEGHPG